MTADEASRPLVDDLHRRISAHSGWNGVTHGRIPQWYGRMLTSLVLAIGSEEVEYLTAGSEALEERQLGRVVVFTRSLVIVTGAEFQAGKDEAEVTTAVYGRRRVARYEVDAKESVFGGGGFSDWPGAVEVSVVYRDGLTLTLPLEHRSSAEQERALHALIGSLRADLER